MGNHCYFKFYFLKKGKEKMKIYIIGPCGSGKTTLAKKLAEKYNTKHYELDLLVFDDKNNHRKRKSEEIDKLFN